MKRSEISTPRVDRKVLPRVDLYTIDVETGKTIKKMVWCEYHKRMEWIGDFYLESEPKAKHSSDVRNMCIEAWDKVKGKYIPDYPTPTATLIMFME